MARRRQKGSGLWVVGGLVLLIAMCRGGGTSSTAKTTAPVAPLLASPPHEQITPVAPVAQPETLYVATGALNQRSSPNGNIVGKSTGGELVRVYERRSEWARISPDNSPPRWVSSRLLCSGTGCYSPPPRRSSPPSPRPRSNYIDTGCPCSGSRVCIGPRGGRYCITSGGNKRYGV